MDFFGNRYYKLNRSVLSISGLWPYLSWKKKCIPLLIVGTDLVTSIIALVSVYFVAEYSVQTMVVVSQTLMPTLIIAVNFWAHLFGMEKVKELLEIVKFDWNTLKRKEEHNIIEKFAETGRLLTAAFTYFFCSLFTGFVIFSVLPPVIDILIPKNESRPHNLPLPGEYFVDQEEYFYYILLHMDAYVVTGMFSLSAGLVLFQQFMQHICAMFCIVGYHLENLTIIEEDNNNNIDESELFAQMANIIQLHSRVLRTCVKLNEYYVRPYFIILGLTVVLLTVDIYQVFHGITFEEDMSLTGISILNMTGCFGALFFVCFVSQSVLDYSSNIFHLAYESHWYLLPISIQKMLILVMVRSAKPSGLAAINAVVASVDLWARTVQSAVSYFMVLYSIQFQ